MSFRAVRSDGNAARVGMFDDRDRGLVEVARGSARGVRIDIVVVRHVLAVQLLGVRQATVAPAGAVEGGRLVRVLPVPQTGDLLPGPSHPTREARTVTEVGDDAAHPASHRYVVGGGMEEGSCSKRLPLRQREAAGYEGIRELRILLRRGDHGH